MQSDMKLWEKASKEQAGGNNLKLTLDLPWGIGPYTVTMEGLKDAQAKRNAVGAYGAHIRGLIKERIDDEAITSRAKAAAARSEQASGPDRDSVSPNQGLRDSSVPEKAVQGAGQAYSQTSSPLVGSRESLVAERAIVENGIKILESRLAQSRKELRVIDMAIAIMEEDDAPQDSGTTEAGSEGTSV